MEECEIVSLEMKSRTTEASFVGEGVKLLPTVGIIPYQRTGSFIPNPADGSLST